jgi:hypothetical protein
MADEVRTVLKNFNRDLLAEELVASLPFLGLQMYGFDRINEFEGAPRTEPRKISRVRQSDGSYSEDWAQPGEIRFQFSADLSAGEDTDLDSILAAHDSTQRTLEQQRVEQDASDWDTLVAQFPSWDSFNNTQRNNFMKLLARAVIREFRTPPI